MPIIMKLLVDIILSKKDPHVFIHFIIVITIILVFFAIISSLEIILETNVINNANKFLRNKIINKIYSINIIQLSKYKMGHFIQLIENDIPVCQGILHSVLFKLVVEVINFIIVIGILFSLDFKLTLFLLVILPIYYIIFILFSNKIESININYLKDKDKISEVVNHIVKNIKLLKKYTHNSKNTFINQFTEIVFNLFKWFKRRGIIDAQINFINSLILTFTTVIVLYFGGMKVIQGSLSVGDVLAFTLYTFNFFNPLHKVTSLVINLNASLVSVRRVNHILNLNENSDAQTMYHFKTTNGEVFFQNYDLKINDNTLLTNINAHFYRNSINIVLGKNGIGKTTLLYSLMGLIEVPSNKIFIDGVDINCIPLTQLKEIVSFVYQDPNFISESVSDHLEINDHHINNKIIEFVEKHKVYFDKKQSVEELSGGKKQLLSFIHACLSNPKILILDECFSNMDSATIQECMTLLNEIKKDITIIIVTHDPAIVNFADNKVELFDNKLAGNEVIV